MWDLHHRSARVVLDWPRKAAKYIVVTARMMGAAAAVEDLDKLWHNASRKSNGRADRLSWFAYRKMIQTLEAKAVEYNIPIVYVDPRNTSRACPRCGSMLSYYWHRLAECPRYGFIADRDTVGALNVYRRALKALASRPGGRGAPGAVTGETRPSPRPAYMSR